MEEFLQINMTKISVYIWGIRYGFQANTALFPEKARLTNPADIKEYENVVKYFSDVKDNYFRQCDKDFYFMLKDSNYKMFSHVYSRHKDIENRISWLVFTIVIPANASIKGDVISALHRLKDFYKIKNADFRENRNLFTPAQIYAEVADLQLINSIENQLKYSNTLIYYTNENELKLNFSSFDGNELYFIQENTNDLMIDQISPKLTKFTLSEMVNNQEKAIQINKEFQSVINSRSNFDLAKKIYQEYSQLLNDSLIKNFIDWKNEIEIKNDFQNTINEFNKYFQEISELEKGNQFIPTDLVNRIEKYGNQLPKDLLEKYKSWKNKYESTQKDVSSKRLESDIASLENEKEFSAFISKFNNVFNQANQSQKQKLERLKEDISKKRYIELKERIEKLFQKIYKVEKATIKKNKEQLLNDVQALIYDVNELPDTYQGDQLLKSLEKFKYLESREWVPKDNSKLIRKLVIGCIVLVLTTGVFFIFKLFPHSEESEKVADSTAESGNSNTQEAAPREPENPEPTQPENSPSGKTDIAYKNNKYRIAKEVLTDKGLEHTNGDYYRFLNQSKWELKRKGSTQWSTVEEKDINYFLSVNAKKIEKVNPPPQGEITLTGIALSKTSLNNLTVGGTAQLSVTFTPVNATNKTANWTSSNSSVASVSSAGKITAINPGKTTITVSSGSFTKTCEVTVVKAGGDEDIPDMTFDESKALEQWVNLRLDKANEKWNRLSSDEKKNKYNNLVKIIKSKQGKGYLEILKRKLE